MTTAQVSDFLRNESRIARVIDAAANTAQRVSPRLADQIRDLWAHEYAEPGYGPKPVVLGNWNEPRWLESDLSPEHKAMASRLWARMRRALEKCGAELEWEDEWASCGDCGRIVRTQPDSYSWQPSFAIVNECELICHECLESGPTQLLRELEGDASRCLTIGSIDPADHGYRLVNEEPLETGWHPGQTDSPKAILRALQDMGVDRVLFQLHENSQFYSRWNAWVHEDDLESVTLDEIREALR